MNDYQADFVGNRGMYAPQQPVYVQSPQKENHDDLIFKGALVIGAYFLIIKPLMKSREEEKKREQQVKDFEAAGNQQGGCNPFDHVKYFSTCVPILKYGFDRRPLTTAKAKEAAKKVWDAIGIIYDEPTKVISAIKSCATQPDVAYLAKVFDEKYKKDMWNYIKGPLSDKSQTKIIDYVKGLPNYIPGQDIAVRVGDLKFNSPTEYVRLKVPEGSSGKVGDVYVLSTDKKKWNKK